MASKLDLEAVNISVVCKEWYALDKRVPGTALDDVTVDSWLMILQSNGASLQSAKCPSVHAIHGLAFFSYSRLTQFTVMRLAQPCSLQTGASWEIVTSFQSAST